SAVGVDLQLRQAVGAVHDAAVGVAGGAGGLAGRVELLPHVHVEGDRQDVGVDPRDDLQARHVAGVDGRAGRGRPVDRADVEDLGEEQPQGGVGRAVAAGRHVDGVGEVGGVGRGREGGAVVAAEGDVAGGEGDGDAARLVGGGELLGGGDGAG